MWSPQALGMGLGACDLDVRFGLFIDQSWALVPIMGALSCENPSEFTNLGHHLLGGYFRYLGANGAHM